MKYLRIRLDQNDADYVEKTVPISEEQIEELLPIFSFFNQKRQVELGEITDSMDEGLSDMFFDFVPNCMDDWGGATVMDIELIEVTKVESIIKFRY